MLCFVERTFFVIKSNVAGTEKKIYIVTVFKSSSYNLIVQYSMIYMSNICDRRLTDENTKF